MSAAMSGTRLPPQPIHNGAAHRHRAARARSAPPVSCQPRLARIPFDPAICRDGILPEILFGSQGPFGMKVLLHDLQNLRVSPQRIAVRPVTAIDQPVRAEDIPDCVESAAVEVRIERHPARHAAQHSGNLDVDLRTFAELPQVGGGRIELWQVIHDDAQAGNAIGQPRHIRYQRRRGIGGIERQAGLGQRLESADEFRLPQFRAQIPAPQVAIPDTSKQRVARETFQLAAELRMTGFQVSNNADDNRVFGGHVQDPLIVLQPRAAFDLDGAHDAETLGNLAISAGQSRLVEYGVLLVRPRHALRTSTSTSPASSSSAWGWGSSSHSSCYSW